MKKTGKLNLLDAICTNSILLLSVVVFAINREKFGVINNAQFAILIFTVFMLGMAFMLSMLRTTEILQGSRKILKIKNEVEEDRWNPF